MGPLAIAVFFGVAMSGTITALEPQKHSRKRVSVYLDGAFAFGLAAALAEDLHVGDWLSDEQVTTLKSADEVQRAYEKALDYLAARPRSEAEVKHTLLKREFSEQAMAQVLRRLRQEGLLDDVAFARYWVENRAQFRPKGKFALTTELRQKGVSTAAIEAALATYDEPEAAYRVAEEQMRRLAHLPPAMSRRRLRERLLRRGFPYDLVQETLSTFPHPNPDSSFERED